MNIRLIHSAIRRQAAKVLVIAAATGLTTFSGGDASAQSGLVSQFANNGSATSSAANLTQAAIFDPGTRVVSASSVRTAADLAPQQLAPGAIIQAVGSVDGDIATANALNTVLVGHSCRSCQQSSCNGNCYAGSCSSGTCGSRSCGTCGNGYCGDGRPLANPCGTACNPYSYVIVEGLYMDRRGESRFSLTRNTSIGDFDFDWAPRVTFGYVPNCTNGWEFTWIGEFQWERNLTVVDPNGNLNTILFDGDGEPDPNVQNDNNFDGTFLDPLFNSNIQIHRYISKYWSGEINKTLVGWDVVKLLYGGRYIRIEEDLYYAGAKDIFNSTADVLSNVDNNMIGGQVGIDILYPIAKHFSTDMRGRAGAYINFAESNVIMRNQGAAVLRTPGDDYQLAGVFEFGGGVRWHLGERFSIRAGGEFWYITGIATAPNQLRPAVTPAWGFPIDTKEDIFLYGANLGAEFRF